MLKSAAAGRNKEPILQVLQIYLSEGPKKVLEIASGTGEHLEHWAPALPSSITWQPSECDPRALHSIVAYLDHHRWPNVRVPLFIDVARDADRWALPDDFGPGSLDAIINVNMIHISSDDAVAGLFSVRILESERLVQASGGLLKKGGLLITYGPYAIDGVLSPQSNVDFDASLRQKNKEWGIRDTTYLKEVQLLLPMN